MMKHIGKSYPIHDGKQKAAGRAIYVGDMNLPHMLHMAILFSTIPHGRVKKIDGTKALELAGVVEILHCFNTEHNSYNRYHTQLGQVLVEHEQIFNEHVRFVGDRVAGVVATSHEIAKQAVALIEVEYEEYPYSLTATDTLTGMIDSVHELGAVYDAMPVEVGCENTDGDLVVVETDSHMGRINHICMETHACVADYDPYLKQLTVHSPSQAVFGIRSVLADMFDMDYNRIRVVKTTMGGSFGGKQEWVLEPATAMASLRTGRPVKLVYSREESIISTYCRAPLDATIKIGYKPDGKMTNLSCDALLDAGAYMGNSLNYALTLGTKFSKLYQLDYVKYTGKVAITNTIVNGAFRGWASPEAAFILEHNLNVAAKRLGMDEVALRMKNLLEPYAEDIKQHITIGNFRAKDALVKGKEMFEWDKRKVEIAQFNAENTRYKRGIGVAMGGHVSSYYPFKTDFARVDMTLTESGTVRCNVTLHDHGCGTVTAFQMIAAEAMGLDLEDIRITEGDTDVTPFDVGCFSSRTTYVVGRTTYECAMQLRDRMKSHFSQLENIPVKDVEMEGKMIFSKSNPELKYSFTKLVEKSQQILKHSLFNSCEFVPDSNHLVAGAHYALVEVDTYTCFTKILDYVAVQDVGQVINREMCVAQTQGAVIMASGAALYEHVDIGRNGKPKGSLKDYHLINSFEAPNVRVAFVEAGNADGPYNSKSIGEACHVPPAAAILGAVNNALDTEIGTIPVTPDALAHHFIVQGGKM